MSLFEIPSILRSERLNDEQKIIAHSIFKIAALIFGLTPIAGFLLNLLDLGFFSQLLNIISIVFLPCGLFIYSRCFTGERARDAQIVVVLLLIFSFLGIVNLLLDPVFNPPISNSPTWAEMTSSAELMVLGSIWSIIVSSFSLVGLYLFSRWFDQLAIAVHVPDKRTRSFMILGVIVFLAALLTLISSISLYSIFNSGQPTTQARASLALSQLESAELGIAVGLLLVILSIIVQIFAGIRLYSFINSYPAPITNNAGTINIYDPYQEEKSVYRQDTRSYPGSVENRRSRYQERTINPATRRVTTGREIPGGKRCPSCGIMSSSNFCERCGKRITDILSVKCPRCGETSNRKFCGYCGNDLQVYRTSMETTSPINRDSAVSSIQETGGHEEALPAIENGNDEDEHYKCELCGKDLIGKSQVSLHFDVYHPGAGSTKVEKLEKLDGFCPYCENQINEDTIFCPSCKNRIKKRR